MTFKPNGYDEYEAPGSAEAKRAGCTCPGNPRRMNDDGLVFDIDPKCPLPFHRDMPEYSF